MLERIRELLPSHVRTFFLRLYRKTKWAWPLYLAWGVAGGDPISLGIAAIVVGGAGTAANIGLGIANSPSAPPTGPQPLTAAANQAAQSQARTAASQATPTPTGATGTQQTEQQILSQLFNGNPQYWGDVVAGVSQALGGGALSAGPQASATAPGLSAASGGWNSILDMLSKSNPSGAGVVSGGGGGGTDIASPLLQGLNNDVFHGFSA